MAKTQKRNEDGLIEGVDYPRSPEGFIDWRSCIPSRFLYFKSDKKKTEVMVEQNVKLEKDVDWSKVEDRYILVMLGGIQHVAWMRGIRSIRPSDLHVTPMEVTSVCTVDFIPNFEDPDGLSVGAQAAANVYNTSGKFQTFLATIAQNRAFVRAVKQALRIRILSDEEFDNAASEAFETQLSKGINPLLVATKAAAPVQEPEPQAASYLPNPLGLLNKLCDERQITFDVLKARAVEYRTELAFAQAMVSGEKIADSFDPVNWTGFNSESICMGDALTLIEKIKAAKKVGKKK